MDSPANSRTPTPVRLGRVNTLRGVRRAITRITDAVLAGDIPPKISNAAIYGLTALTRVLEMEVFEVRLKKVERDLKANVKPTETDV